MRNLTDPTLGEVVNIYVSHLGFFICIFDGMATKTELDYIGLIDF